jgi:Rod binding domain-containing protein
MTSTFPVQNIDPRYAMQGMESLQARAAEMKIRAQQSTAAATTGETTTDTTSATSTTPDAQKSADMDKLLGEFQGIMFSEMMKAMRSTVPKSDLFKKSTGEETFESFLDEQYANATSQGVGGLGLTEALKQQLGLTDKKALSAESVYKKNQTSAIQAARSQAAILSEKE